MCRSLGAEVNWGIRFRNQQDADVFLLDLAGEVRLCAQSCKASWQGCILWELVSTHRQQNCLYCKIYARC